MPTQLAYSVSEACKALGISRSHLYEQVRRKRLRIVKIGSRTLVPASEIERLLSESREEGQLPGSLKGERDGP